MSAFNLKKAYLSGTHDGKHWKLGKESEPSQAIFPIFSEHDGKYRLHGTGFYISLNGLFVTAKHVAEDCREINEIGHSIFLIHTFSNNQFCKRPIGRMSIHDHADVALGWPNQIIDNKTGKEFRGKCVSLDINYGMPGHKPKTLVGEPVVTYAYALHDIDNLSDPPRISVQPQLYDGVVKEFYEASGPSIKLRPPYFRSSIHMHGATSGAPVINTEGNAMGIASSSYDGSPDVSFITPIERVLEMVLHQPTASNESTASVTVVQWLAVQSADLENDVTIPVTDIR